jgi:hypothetical protein
MGNNRKYLVDTELLGRAKSCYEDWAEFRRERERCKRFTYGDQWGDPVNDNGVIRSEADYIMSQGNMPLKNNLIRRLVRNVLGVYRNRWKEPTCRANDVSESRQAEAMQRLLRYNSHINRLEELYARSVEEFLIGGLVIHKKWYGRKGNNTECWTDFVQPDNFFVDSKGHDFRGWDISLIGEIHEMNFDSLCASFAADAEERNLLGCIYGADPRINGTDIKCKVVEVWQRVHPAVYRCHDTLLGRCYKIPEEEFDDIVSRENAHRLELFGENARLIEAQWMLDDEWQYSFLTPTGHVIRAGKSPYQHGSHPYVFKAYPYIDGEIHSFVADIIDQQKYTNRLISMYDWILRASAKGVLLFPEGSLPEGVSIDDIAEEWSRFNGVIVFRPRTGVPLPQQISSKAADIGITDLLNIQLQMMEDVSGINGALQGKLENGSMSGTLYNQQTRNAMTALTDLLRSFEDFMSCATAIDAANIRQYYTSQRIEAILGVGMGNLFLSTHNFYSTPLDFTII